MTEFFPSSFATIQPGPGTLVLGSNNGAPYNVDTSQIATFSYVETAISLAASAASGAALDSPNFTGMPTAPTAAPGSDDMQIANTAFVYNAVAAASIGVGSGSASGSVTVVTSFDGRYGQVTLLESDVTMALGFMPAASGGNADYEFAVAPASGSLYATPLSQVESLIEDASTAYAASGGNANCEFAVAPATGSMYATPLGQVETLIQAASGMYAELNGSIEEQFSVAPSTVAYQAPQWGQTVGGASTMMNYTAERALGTTYTNTTGRPLYVAVHATSAAADGYLSAYVGGYYSSVCITPENASGIAVDFIVPPGITYEVAYGTATLVSWIEY